MKSKQIIYVLPTDPEGRVLSDNSRPCKLIRRALSMLPSSTKKFLRKEGVRIFFSYKQYDDLYAFVWSRNNFLRHEFKIYITAAVWRLKADKIIFTILHELAHCYLAEKPVGRAYYWLCKDSNEGGADALANCWLKEGRRKKMTSKVRRRRTRYRRAKRKTEKKKMGQRP